jgi:ATP-binding cassette subfamily C protein
MAALGILDFLGMAFLGILSISVFDVEKFENVSGFLPGNISVQIQGHLFYFALIISLLFVVKSILLITVSKVQFSFLAREQSSVAVNMARSFFSQPINKIEQKSSNEISYFLTTGVDSAITIILSSVAVFVADLFLIIILMIPLFLFDPMLAVFSALYFALLAIVVIKFLNPLAQRTGVEEAEKNIESMMIIKSIVGGFRELKTYLRIDRFINLFSEKRYISSKFFTLRLFLQQVPKFVFELSLIFGVFFFVLIKGISSTPANELITSIIVFITAAFRLAPSLLRLQTSIIVLKSTIGLSSTTTSFQKYLPRGVVNVPLLKSTEKQTGDCRPHVSVKNLSFSYHNSDLALEDISFEVPGGSSLAIVGKSGAGKSTLMDCLLGLIEPSSGSVKIAGFEPEIYQRTQPNTMAYLPQQIALLDGSVRENVLLDLNVSQDFDDEIWEKLTIVRLNTIFENLSSGLDTQIGENGTRLSGGERQRLGLARLLMKEPKLILLDEATSALDPTTESVINNQITNLAQKATIIVISHKYSNIKNFDNIVFLDNGKILGQGKFDYLRNSLPIFDQQCLSLGL